MGLIPTPPNEQCHIPDDYEFFEEKAGTAAYYNVPIQKESNEKQNEDVYEDVSQFYNWFFLVWLRLYFLL